MSREAHEGVILGGPEVECGTRVVSKLWGLDVTRQVEVHLQGVHIEELCV